MAEWWERIICALKITGWLDKIQVSIESTGTISQVTRRLEIKQAILKMWLSEPVTRRLDKKQALLKM